MKINEIVFPSSQYYAKPQKKKQIVIHHTVSNPLSVLGDIEFWKSDPSRIATFGVIGYDGMLNKCFPSEMWAHHLGVKMSVLKSMGFKDYSIRNEVLNRNSIAIEIDSWGPLVKRGSTFFNVYNKPIDKSLEVVECNWRGYKYFQKYSDAQIATLKELCEIFMSKYSIPNQGLVDGDFDLRHDALAGKPGIYSHSNFRDDKSDLYPDKRIVEMLLQI